jgi:polyketide cyclase/dehydrase/lipid transport protein
MDDSRSTNSDRHGLSGLLRGKPALFGILGGVAYGLIARAAHAVNFFTAFFPVMTLSFLFVVPIVLGAITVNAVTRPSIVYRIFAPWVPTVIVVLVSGLIGWEGAICIIMALPMLLVFASFGGLVGGSKQVQGRGARAAILVMPFLLSPIESQFTPPTRLVETVTEIDIEAPVETVWPLVTSVDSIEPAEQRPALFTRMGFPRPVSATIAGSGIGAVRSARFERGLVFTETVTEWVPQRRLSFTIDPNTESIPPTTLDPHVTIGGPFFDVLTGTYELHPTHEGRSTRLTLRSRHRVSTRFNLYANWWADQIMASIQQNILRVHKERSEHGSAR